MKTTIAILALSLMLLNESCTSNDDEPAFFSEVPYNLNTKILKDSFDIMEQYRSAHGIGKDNDSLVQTEIFTFSSFSGSALDTVFSLPLNLNKDTTGFVFVAKDNTRDTVVLAYRRFPSIGNFDYRLDVDSIKFVFLSSRLDETLCSVSSDNMVTDFFDKEFTMKLFRK